MEAAAEEPAPSLAALAFKVALQTHLWAAWCTVQGVLRPG